MAILRKVLTVWTVQQAAVFSITKVADVTNSTGKTTGSEQKVPMNKPEVRIVTVAR